MLERLPTETLVNMLSFNDIPTKVKLARCNLTLQQRVYRECPQAWESVCFCKFTFYAQDVCRRMTDLQLSILLTRVSAREVTKELDLTRCKLTRGQGLRPLQQSQVLERVDLYGTNAENDPAPFL